MSKPTTEQFIEDMQQAGLEVRPYSGRYFWEGPAVRVDDIADAMSETTVKCQFDSMGLGYIVYPKVSDPDWFAIHAEDDDEENDD